MRNSKQKTETALARARIRSERRLAGAGGWGEGGSFSRMAAKKKEVVMGAEARAPRLDVCCSDGQSIVERATTGGRVNHTESWYREGCCGERSAMQYAAAPPVHSTIHCPSSSLFCCFRRYTFPGELPADAFTSSRVVARSTRLSSIDPLCLYSSDECISPRAARADSRTTAGGRVCGCVRALTATATVQRSLSTTSPGHHTTTTPGCGRFAARQRWRSRSLERQRPVTDCRGTGRTACRRTPDGSGHGRPRCGANEACRRQRGR